MNRKQTPRDLAGDYAKGLLSFDDYRSKRRQLIDRQLCEEGRLEVRQGRNPKQEKNIGFPGRFLKIVLVTGGLTLMAIVAWWLLSSGNTHY